MQAVRTNEHYLVFLNITNDQLAEIDRKRATIGEWHITLIPIY